MSTKQTSSLQTLILDLPPSCIQFAPDRPAYFVIGTYNLVREDESQKASSEDATSDDNSSGKKPQNRNGSLILCELENGKISIISTTPTSSAVLDLQFRTSSSHWGSDYFAIATSTGKVQLWHFDIGHLELHLFRSWTVASEDILVLSLTWLSIDTDFVVATLSNGRCVFLNTDLASRVGYEEAPVTISLHADNPWTAAHFLPPSNDGIETIYVGDDTSALSSYTLTRQCSGITERMIPSDYTHTQNWTNNKIHGAGVTAILPLTETMILTGSYDDHLRVLLVPAAGTPGRPRVAAECDLGGGVWRLKLLSFFRSISGEAETYKARVLVSCMHAGACIVTVTLSPGGGEWTIQVQAKFDEHESMCYACDAQPLDDEAENTDQARWIVSTSFYDRRLCLWRDHT